MTHTKSSIYLCSIFLFCLNCFAEETTSIENQNSLSQNIENEKLSVMKGSDSTWSLQFTLSYLGSSLDTPFSDYAPNPQNDPVAPRVTLGGTYSARKRISEDLSFGLGTGLQVDTPFHKAQNFTLANPVLDVSWSAMNLFWISSLMIYSDPIYKNYGYASTLTQSAYGIFWTKKDWSLGSQFGMSYNFLSKSDFGLIHGSAGVYPFIEYRLGKGFILRQSFAFTNYYVDDFNTWYVNPRTASTSIGFAINKIIYFSPYLFYSIEKLSQLTPKEISIGISCNFNIF